MGWRPFTKRTFAAKLLETARQSARDLRCGTRNPYFVTNTDAKDTELTTT